MASLQGHGQPAGASQRRGHGAGAVLAIADSFTFGAYVDNEDTWPAQLEGLLVRRNPDRAIAVGNAGIARYGIVQELEYLREKGLALRHGLVVLGFNPNDIEMDMWPERLAQIRRPRDENGSRSALRFSAAATYVNSLGVAWQRRRAMTSASIARETSERGYQEYATAFRRFVATVTQAGVRLVVVAFPQVKQLVADACSDAPNRATDEVMDDGVNGFVVGDGDVGQMVARIEQLAARARQKAEGCSTSGPTRRRSRASSSTCWRWRGSGRRPTLRV